MNSKYLNLYVKICLFSLQTISQKKALDWLKYNIFTGKIPKQNPHWTKNRHLSNEGQECKTGQVKGRVQEMGKDKWRG
jgi:hypothetical protein